MPEKSEPDTEHTKVIYLVELTINSRLSVGSSVDKYRIYLDISQVDLYPVDIVLQRVAKRI